ncbi:MAG: hypothetical protein LBB23_01690 [Rickettsiales bacterium]|jgi:hypothetical protein|nr:hypothetical protein [Rickettsiales bacterium]
MSTKFIEYKNFIKISAHLVNHGYITHWNRVDDNGADFICIHNRTCAIFKIQLKSRITVDPKKYAGKNIFMAFPKREKFPNKDWVIVKHDALLKIYHNMITPNKIRSSPNVPNKDWNAIKKISIIPPFDFS